MSKNLVIVESPAKCKTIKKYLGKGFEVMASYGHVRDLVPKEGLATVPSAPAMQAKRSIRMFCETEMNRLDTECRGFILYLEQMGVLTPTSREVAIERAMALENEDFDIEQMKWVILMVLFNQPGEEAAYAWVEDLVFDTMATGLH